MATKEVELREARAGRGALGKAADDEPVFILRAQDRFAPEAVEQWAGLLQAHIGRETLKVAEARVLARAMRAWQETHTSKVPD